jgi:hypothetical protein
MKTERTKAEWLVIANHCLKAYIVAPKYSPMRLFFSWGEKYARKKAANTSEVAVRENALI